MRLAFVYLQGRSARLAELARGEAPSEFFYGAAELAAAGHTVEHFEFGAEVPAAPLAALLDLLRRAYLTPPKLGGDTLTRAWALCPELNAFDCIVATTGHIAFALAACAAVGRLRRPIVAIQCGLLHHPYHPLRRAMTRGLLNRMHSLLFGEAERAPMLEQLGVEPSRLQVNQFGVDSRYWTPGGEREDYVLAIGNDPRRDYATLLAAAEEIAAPIRIVTRLPLPEPLPANVSVLRGSWQDRALSDADIRELYRRAACVVTPLHDTIQPSGQSVTLQAMACGAPVVVTRTRGLWDAALAGSVKLVAPSDPGQLAAAVRGILSDKSFAQTGLASVRSIDAFALGIAGACERAIISP